MKLRKFSMFLGVLGLLSFVCAIPAAASTIDLNTGNTTNPYVITADTLDPAQGTSVADVTSLGSGWVSALSGTDWISWQANQSNSNPTVASEMDAGYVTYQTTFSLPSLNPGSTIAIEFAADDWTTITLNGDTFYTGPAGCNDTTGNCGSTNPGSWTSDTILTIPSTVDALLTSGTNTLTFQVWNMGGGSDAGGGPTGLDAAVSVNYTASAVPEPSTALPLVGLVLAGAALRRRRFCSSNAPTS